MIPIDRHTVLGSEVLPSKNSPALMVGVVLNVSGYTSSWNSVAACYKRFGDRLTKGREACYLWHPTHTDYLLAWLPLDRMFARRTAC